MIAEIKGITIAILIAIQGPAPKDADREVCQGKIEELAMITQHFAPMDNHLFFCDYILKETVTRLDDGKEQIEDPVYVKGSLGEIFKL